MEKDKEKKIKNFLMQQELGSVALHQAMEGKRGSIDENRLRTIIRELLKNILTNDFKCSITTKNCYNKRISV